MFENERVPRAKAKNRPSVLRLKKMLVSKFAGEPGKRLAIEASRLAYRHRSKREGEINQSIFAMLTRVGNRPDIPEHRELKFALRLMMKYSNTFDVDRILKAIETDRELLHTLDRIPPKPKTIANC